MITMKPIASWLLAAAMTAGLLAGCGPRKALQQEPAAETPAETCFTAIDKYLVDSIGHYYSPADYCIPFHDYVTVDESNADDIQVSGSFWVLNYTQAGDTLKTMSGGSHPGKMHVRRTTDGHFEVTAFEPVGDGSNYLPTARRIFGDRFEEFQQAVSDEKHREAVRKEVLAAFVEREGLAVKYYQDFGWPAVPIQ